MCLNKIYNSIMAVHDTHIYRYIIYTHTHTHTHTHIYIYIYYFTRVNGGKVSRLNLQRGNQDVFLSGDADSHSKYRSLVCVGGWVHASVNTSMLHLTGGSKSYSTLC